MDGFGVNRPVARTEDQRLLTGGGRYIDDVNLPNQAYGYLLRSPHAHARIVKIDTTAAKKAPGVLDIVTGADWVTAGFGNMPYLANPMPGFDPKAMVQAVHRPLAVDKARHVGDGVAYIVAETRAQAKDAAELIEVDYAPLPSVTETGLAPSADAPVIWNEAGTNVAYVFHQGDQAKVNEAFAAAKHVVKQRIVINRLTASPMETRGIVASYDPKTGFCTVHLGNQNAFVARAQIADGLLHMDPQKFRVIAGDVGCSFGMKGAMYPENPLTVWASHRLGRPVKWVSERSEAFQSDAHARDKVIDAELALDADHKFLAMRVHAISNVGAYYSTMTTFPIILSTSGLAGTYTTPAIHFKATAVFSNTNPTTPYRGSGRPDAAYIGERIVDFAARELGIDPAELRRRNMVTSAMMPYQTPLGAKYDSGDFPKNQEIVLAKADYAGFAKRRAEAKSRGKLRGIGIGNNVEGGGTSRSRNSEGRNHAQRRCNPVGRLDRSGPRPCDHVYADRVGPTGPDAGPHPRDRRRYRHARNRRRYRRIEGILVGRLRCLRSHPPRRREGQKHRRENHGSIRERYRFRQWSLHREGHGQAFDALAGRRARIPGRDWTIQDNRAHLSFG